MPLTGSVFALGAGIAEMSGGRMEIVVRGRNVVVPDHFRQHVAERLGKIERYDQKIIRIDVELHHERNKRQSERCERIEITSNTRGPVIRAEACDDDFYKALELAVVRLERRFRSAADRRRVHHGRHTPVSVAQATGSLTVDEEAAREPGSIAVAERDADIEHQTDSLHQPNGDHDHGLPQLEGDLAVARIVRVKDHDSVPMAVDQALWEMELVGHDFYLFLDKETGLPSVVYRRKGYDYGVIRLTS
jgi:ribosomal subunit interface protein